LIRGGVQQFNEAIGTGHGSGLCSERASYQILNILAANLLLFLIEEA
jgi:hypothetical protein